MKKKSITGSAAAKAPPAASWILFSGGGGKGRLHQTGCSPSRPSYTRRSTRRDGQHPPGGDIHPPCPLASISGARPTLSPCETLINLHQADQRERTRCVRFPFCDQELLLPACNVGGEGTFELFVVVFDAVPPEEEEADRMYCEDTEKDPSDRGAPALPDQDNTPSLLAGSSSKKFVLTLLRHPPILPATAQVVAIMTMLQHILFSPRPVNAAGLISTRAIHTFMSLR